MYRAAIFAFVAIGLAACQPTTPQVAKSPAPVITQERYVCSLGGVTATRGTATVKDPAKGLSAFALIRGAKSDEKNQFLIGSKAGTSIGAGTQRTDGTWVIRNWQKGENGGPPITLVSFFPDKQILLSVRSGPNAHVTYGGVCREP